MDGEKGCGPAVSRVMRVPCRLSILASPPPPRDGAAGTPLCPPALYGPRSSSPDTRPSPSRPVPSPSVFSLAPCREFGLLSRTGFLDSAPHVRPQWQNRRDVGTGMQPPPGCEPSGHLPPEGSGAQGCQPCRHGHTHVPPSLAPAPLGHLPPCFPAAVPSQHSLSLTPRPLG